MRREWFAKSDAFDASVRDAFLRAWEAEAAGLPATDWGDSPEAGCARIVLLDQFPRNMFRNDARSFATDALALALARKMVDEGADRRLPTQWHRMFCYLPFEHAESLAEQDRSVALSTALRNETDGKVDVVKWAVKHRAVIARFGRFPHRNAALGRRSTPDEEQFLREPGARF
jgi:uncharacterized protein (DUF924 family)